MFSSKYLTTVSKIRVVVVTRGDGDADGGGGFERTAVSPSFPNLLYTVFKSSNASPLPDIFSTMFFFRYCGWWRLPLNDCIKRWRRSKYITSSATWLAVTRPEFSKVQAVTQKLFFVAREHLLMHRVLRRMFETRNCTRMIGWSLERFRRNSANRELFF